MLQTLLGTEFESVRAYSCDSTSKSSSTGKEHVPNTCLRSKVRHVPPVLPLERGAWPAKPPVHCATAPPALHAESFANTESISCKICLWAVVITVTVKFRACSVANLVVAAHRRRHGWQWAELSRAEQRAPRWPHRSPGWSCGREGHVCHSSVPPAALNNGTRTCTGQVGGR